jgi:DNA polymerase-3 subunit delta
MLTRVSLPITLIAGSEEVLVKQAIEEARAEAREREGADPDRRTVSAADESAVPALAEALGPTLFDEPALIIVTEADQIDDALWRVLEAAIADPPPGVALVIAHPGGVKGKKYLTALRAAGAKDVTCAALKKGRQTEDFLAAEVRRRGRKATPGAIHALYESIGHDVALLLGAIAQLCSDVETGPIDEEAVARYFVGVADVQGYRVSDAVWDRRPVDALRDLRWMAESSGRAGVGPAVTAMLGTGLRALVRVQGLPPTMSEAEAMQETGIRFDWQLRNARTRAKRWRADRLALAVVGLADLDVAVKGGLREGDSRDVDQKLHDMESYVVRTASRSDA